ncbi:MAG: acetyl-CoA C-acyltransferase, partial [Anaerolineales bacterium]|nr:acetyl-CoA C-acyltransferase [Anaerolineales bacterium]
MRQAVIVAASRTAVGKSRKGITRHQRSDEMAASVIQELLRQTEGMLSTEDIDDVIVGCAMPEGSQGMNTARVIALRAGLPVDVPAQTVNRFCSSGLQTVASAAERIIAGGAETIIAGGVETMSLVPMTGFRISPNPFMSAEQPEIYMNMGLTAERVAEKFEVSRQSQDEFAFRSHKRAAAATAVGKFKEEIVPVVFEEVSAGKNGDQKRHKLSLEVDEHLRQDTTLEGLAKLRPVFKEGGTVTAGNASPLSDGAAGVIVMDRETAENKGLTPLLRFLGFGVAG